MRNGRRNDTEAAAANSGAFNAKTDMSPPVTNTAEVFALLFIVSNYDCYSSKALVDTPDVGEQLRCQCLILTVSSSSDRCDT
jgi:hypothetical protein